MKVSELVAALQGHQPDGLVVISEIDAVPQKLFVIEWIEDGLLMVRRWQSEAARNSIFSEALFEKAFKAHMRGERWQRSYKTTVDKSPMDGRYRVSVNGSPLLQEGFETELEANSFLKGFVLGFGAAEAEAEAR